MKKILITGGSGFIGTNFINYILKKNIKILNIDKLSSESTPEKFKNKINKKKYKFYNLDLQNLTKLKKIIFTFKPDVIVNFAAESHVDRSIDKPYNFIKNNFTLSLNLFSIYKEYFKKYNFTKFIHISTDEVFGSNKSTLSNENSPYKPSSPYSSSKAATDLVALSFNETYKTNITIVNLCNNYGPFQFLEKFIPTCIFRLTNNKTVPIYGKGTNIREWIYVDDTCEAILKLIKNKSKNNRFNIGSNKRLDNFGIATKIFHILKTKNKTNLNLKNFFKHVKDRPGHDFRYALNSTLFNNEFNYKVKNNIDLGLLKTVNWYLNNTNWAKFMKNKYTGKRLGLND